MKFYINLQFKRMKRMLSEFGVNPYLGFILTIIIFFSFSKYLFHNTSYAKWMYLIIGILVIFKLGEKNRNDLLISIFKKKTYYRIRLLENTLFAFPFLLYLLYEKSYLIILLLATLSILIIPLKFKQNLNYTIPTPFRKYPFEFIVGFRKTFLLHIFSYLLCYEAIHVGNFSLGLFSLLLIYLISMFNYSKPENPYYVWIYSANSKIFLRKKIISSFICSSFIALPNFLSLFFFFKENYILIVGITLIGLIFLISAILAKYSVFPYEMPLLQGLIYALSLWIPPFLLIIIPIFYMQSKKSLDTILE